MFSRSSREIFSRRISRFICKRNQKAEDLKCHNHKIWQCTSMYHAPTDAPTNQDLNNVTVEVVDMRSDTVTKPSPAMRQAMVSCEVGDDVFGEDPTVNELQNRVAKMFGMDKALFVPTGTMGNVISLMTHCNQRGVEALIGDLSHISIYEQGGIAQVAGILPRFLHNLPDGTFDIKELLGKIVNTTDPHFSNTRLICLENTHNRCGGKILPLQFMKQVKEIAESHSLNVHLDGARVLNASVAMDKPVDQILKYCDSVNMCFSKGLGAPVGSIIAGTEQFIASAVRMRKVLGGGMRQAGILAACALVSLDEAESNIQNDHFNALTMAQGIMTANTDQLFIDVQQIQSNIVFIQFLRDITSKEFCQRLTTVTKQEEIDLGQDNVVVKMSPWTDTSARFVTHRDLSPQHIHKAIQKVHYTIHEFENPINS